MLTTDVHSSHASATSPTTRPAHFKPMHAVCEAAERGDLQQLTELLARGADANAIGEKGNSALAFACANGHADCTAALIRAGANVNHTSHHGNAPLSAAVFADSVRCMRQLVDARADINLVGEQSPDKTTPLHMAVTLGRLESLHWLISRGADRTVRKLDGMTPLVLATALGHPACEKLLRKADDDDAREAAHAKAEQDAAARAKAALEYKVKEERANAAAAALLAELEAEGAVGAGKAKGKAAALRIVAVDDAGAAGGGGSSSEGKKRRNKNKKNKKKGKGGGSSSGGGEAGAGDDDDDAGDLAALDEAPSREEVEPVDEVTAMLEQAILARRTQPARCPHCGSRSARTARGECPACLKGCTAAMITGWTPPAVK